MIRILQVVGTMDLGGIETLLMNIYRNCNRKELQFDFLCHNRVEAAYTNEIIDLGGRLFSIPGVSHVGMKKYNSNLRSFFDTHQEYSIVHSHMNDLSGLVLKQAYNSGIENRYAHSHTVYNHRAIPSRILLGVLKRYIDQYATRSFSCSIPSRDQLFKGSLRDSCVIIPNGIDTARFKFNDNIRAQVRGSFGISEELVIGHVGRFAPVKNHTFIIDCFLGLLQFRPDAKLLLVGSGELENEIRQKVQHAGIGRNVIFAGSRQDVNHLLSAMDIFLFPSIREGLPVSVIEAQASGLIVVASDSISEESSLTDIYIRLSLSQGAERWSSMLLDVTNRIGMYDRKRYSEIVAAKGFDIKRTTDKLSSIYMTDSNKLKRDWGSSNEN